ncbi:MAG: hypothetical protein DRN12_05745, partial [Thermoplasmata archaeon]
MIPVRLDISKVIDPETGYIDIIRIVPDKSFKNPFSIIINAPNGTGKTTSALNVISYIFHMKEIVRYYITFISHEQAKKYLNFFLERQKKVKDVTSYIPIVYHEGIERVCQRKDLLKEMKELGLPLSYACKICDLNYLAEEMKKYRDLPKEKAKQKKLYVVSKIVKEAIEKRYYLISSMSLAQWLWEKHAHSCAQQVIRTLIVEPMIDDILKRKLLIITPLSIFSTKTIINRWKRYFKAQRKYRIYFAFFDEIDELFFKGFEYELPPPNFTDFDYEVVEKVISKSFSKTRFFNMYETIYKLFKLLLEGKVLDSHIIKAINYELEVSRKLINHLSRKLSSICKIAYECKKRTIIPEIISNLLNLENVTKQMINASDLINDSIIVHDLDFAYNIICSVDFPFRYWIKLSTTATLPDTKVIDMSNMLEESKIAFARVIKVDIYPLNTYLLYYRIFDDMPERNEEIAIKIKEILNIIRKSIETYKKIVNDYPRGVLVFLGNKYQLNIIRQAFLKFGYNITPYIFEVMYGEIPITFSYCSSPVSRALDLTQYDISLVISPLLRPPRFGIEYDSLDIAKAVAEAIQSLFRIVR